MRCIREQEDGGVERSLWKDLEGGSRLEKQLFRGTVYRWHECICTAVISLGSEWHPVSSA